MCTDIVTETYLVSFIAKVMSNVSMGIKNRGVATEVSEQSSGLDDLTGT